MPVIRQDGAVFYDSGPVGYYRSAKQVLNEASKPESPIWGSDWKLCVARMCRAPLRHLRAGLSEMKTAVNLAVWPFPLENMPTNARIGFIFEYLFF